MATALDGKTVAILATDGVEQIELLKPRDALRDAGATALVVSPKSGEIQGFNHHDKGDSIPVDRVLDDAKGDAFDALVLPGGVINPDDLRLSAEAIGFIRHFAEAGKPIAAICHGPWTLIDAGAVRGKTMTSWASLKTDLENAGATWVDEEAVVDGTLLTSRNPNDLPAFCTKLIELVGGTAGRKAAE